MAEENLKIQVHELSFKSDASGGIFTDPSIYIKIKLGKEEFKTKTSYGKAKSAKFNDTFDLGNGRREDRIIVQAWDEGTFSDDFIGECSIFMDQLKVGIGKKGGFTMLKETKSIGVIYLESIYVLPEKVQDENKEEKAAEV